MPSKRSKKGKRSIALPRKHSKGSRLDLSLYSAAGYASWLAKAQKASKRKRTYS